jgi:hypothetical protein
LEIKVPAAMMNLANCKGSMSTATSGGVWKASDGASDQFPAGLRVLVVDDDPTCLVILEKMLRTCRYEGIYGDLCEFYFQKISLVSLNFMFLLWKTLFCLHFECVVIFLRDFYK